MKLPKILNITEWLSNQSPKLQAQFEMLFFLGPFFAGWIVFLYYWVFLLWDAWSSLPAPSVIMSGGYILYFRWVNVVRNEATSLDAFNMKIDWNESICRSYQNVVQGWEIIESPELTEIGYPIPNFCIRCGDEVPRQVEIGDQYIVPQFCPSCGIELAETGVEFPEDLDSTKFFFKRTNTDPNGQEWSTSIFIHHGDKDRVFRKQPNQWFSYGGQLFPTSTANVRATYVGWMEGVEVVKFFVVTSSPEMARRTQMDLGYIPTEVGSDDIKRVMDLSSKREGAYWRKKYNELNSYVELLEESFEDNKDKAYRGMNRIWDNVEKIREKERKPFWTERDNQYKIVLGLVALLIGAWLLWSYVIPWLFPVQETIPNIPGNETNGVSTQLTRFLLMRLKHIV